MSKEPDQLHIREAKENNLKSIDLDIPHNSFSVVTGRSGSGKSSLAFNTVYAEGQRRYIETFSPYTRQFFDKVKKPEARSLSNVRPAIAIQQRTRIRNSRSTVGSITNINEYLRILWSHVSKPTCPKCLQELVSWNPQSVLNHLQSELSKQFERFVISSPLQIAKKSHAALEIERLRTLGYSRVVNAQTGEIFQIEGLKDKKGLAKYNIALDRVSSSKINNKRIYDALTQAFELGLGTVHILAYKEDEVTNFLFQAAHSCVTQDCKITQVDVPKIRPALFSYNHPIGACTDCKGFGKILLTDEKLCIPNPNLSLEEGAIAPWEIRATPRERGKLKAFCKNNKISYSQPWRKLNKAEQELILHHKSRDFYGVFPWFERLERKAYKMHVRVFLSRYRSQFECPTCHGNRLNGRALLFQLSGKSLPNIWEMSLLELSQWLVAERKSLGINKESDKELFEIFEAIESRVNCLVDLGLPYLQLGRQARTLSGGETQRVNLAGAIGSNLVSTQFVLDEPSVGLHPRDSDRLIRTVKDLAKKGNSVLVVEHDPECIDSADHIIEVGPEAGSQGGSITFSGSRSKWDDKPLFEASLPEISTHKVAKKPKSTLTIKNANKRNLKAVSCHIPVQSFTCISGVSGSGKSTLVSEVIMQGYKSYEYGLKVGKENVVKGFEHFSQVVLIDQSPLSKSPRANIATYSGIWDTARTLLSSTEDAALRKLTKSAFSFNVDAGRCTACSGAGHIREDMQFLSDIYVPCEVCLGKRFQPGVLEVCYKGKNVDDLLNLSVAESIDFFGENKKVLAASELLNKLGLGYLRLGHSLSELSGGEAQRLKLVPFLKDKNAGNALLIFDEPTTGLHPKDIRLLIALFQELRKLGHTILCIEHNPSLLLSSDWMIDLGPEGGDAGGKVVQVGTPSEFLSCDPNNEQLTALHLQAFEKTVNSRLKKKTTAKKKASSSTQDPEKLEIRRASEHNLKDIDIDIPLDQLVAITGVSGSGKSTIAKDIIFAEGQRRYLDCLSPYARQFIKELKRPSIGSIENVKPTICVHQHTFRPSKLSTIATLSEVYNHLRLLYSKVGTQFCPDHPSIEISPQSAKEIAHDILLNCKGSVRLLAPVVKSKKGYHKEVFQRALDLELADVRVDGVFGKASQFLEGLEKSKTHTIEYCIGKFNISRTPKELVIEAVKQALLIGSGGFLVITNKSERTYSSDRSCPKCKQGFFKPDPEDFSFNSRRGACPKCSGTGRSKNGKNTCKECGGSRLMPLGQNVRVSGMNIHEACLLNSRELEETLSALEFEPTKQALSTPILRELVERLRTLNEMGLDYLPLDRDCTMLSSGELQRLRLSAAMGTPLSGAMYIFDEPSVGLHPSDTSKVLYCLRSLQERGNSVVVIEHDPETILACDYIVDIGPEGGSRGGEVVFSGETKKCLESGVSPTAQILRQSQNPPPESKPSKSLGTLEIRNGSRHNISNLSLDLPLGNIISVAGVSGAGKSSLVHGIIAETIVDGKGKGNSWKHGDVELQSEVGISRVLVVDQKPLGKTSRSTPASYLGIWTEIRKLFASAIDAKTRGFDAKYFSYNTGKGACPSCKGQGSLKMEMSFLADARVECEICNGSRFSDEASSVSFLGKSITDILNFTFEEAAEFFVNHRKIHKSLHKACELGLGYLTLGQSSATLSGGESQRLKLVTELSKTRTEHTLYILDEPTTGLHKSDVKLLIKVLQELRTKGNTVLVIEHDSDILLSSDHIVEMGPGADKHGGKVIAQGPPKKLMKAKTPWGTVFQSMTTK